MWGKDGRVDRKGVWEEMERQMENEGERLVLAPSIDPGGRRPGVSH